jgi:hypothetical protein
VTAPSLDGLFPVSCAGFSLNPPVREEADMKIALRSRSGSKSLIIGLILAVCAGSAFACVPQASAQEEDKVVREPDKTVYKKKTVIDFNDVTLEGDLTKPEGSYILNRRATKFGSLIKLRADFNPELQKSVDNL